MNPYIPINNCDREEMLKAIGVNSVENLFSDISEDLKIKGELKLNCGLSEMEVSKKLALLSKMNMNTEDYPCFLGAGVYDHYIPHVVKHVTSMPGFYTSYTPYQAEISQGTLQAIFEYQTLICNLTGMDASNASVYDGATAACEAAFIAHSATNRDSIIVSKTVSPRVRRVLKTYLTKRDIKLIEVDMEDGATNFEKLKEMIDKNTAGVILQNPNFFGVIEDLNEIEKIIHDNKSLFILSVDPISLAVLKTPGELGADIAIGNGQALGNTLSFGGPYFGFMAVKQKYLRKLPGRIVGETKDLNGKRAFVLTLQAREQHIRREKASSNICSNQALNALTALVYLSAMGRDGLKSAAELSMKKAHYALNKITAKGIFKGKFEKPFFKEFVIKGEGISANRIKDYLLQNGIIGGYDLGLDYPELKDCMMIACTEKRTKDEIEKLSSLLEGLK